MKDNKELIVLHAEVKQLHEKVTEMMHKPVRPDINYSSINHKLCQIELELVQALIEEQP